MKKNSYWSPAYPVMKTFLLVMKLKINTHAHVVRSAYPLRKKISIFGVFLVLVFLYLAEYQDIRGISPYLVQIRENTDQKNLGYGPFSLSDFDIKTSTLWLEVLCRYIQYHVKCSESNKIVESYFCGQRHVKISWNIRDINKNVYFPTLVA